MRIEYSMPAIKVKAQSFQPELHYYNKVLHAQMHQIVKFFFSMKKERIIERYCNLNPSVDKQQLDDYLSYVPKYIQWSGTDLFHVTTAEGIKKMVVIETNSSPSGQKSMPLLNDNEEMGGYKRLIEKAFLPYVKSKKQFKVHMR